MKCLYIVLVLLTANVHAADLERGDIKTATEQAQVEQKAAAAQAADKDENQPETHGIFFIVSE